MSIKRINVVKNIHVKIGIDFNKFDFIAFNDKINIHYGP